jgi:hypothetical protein
MRIRILMASLAALLSFSIAVAKAEPLITSGIGLANCGKLAPSLKPGAGLDHLPNALLFYWTQGYLSAVNFFLLDKYADYVDVGAVTEPTITRLVHDFCTANPDKKPISAIDQFIRETDKVAAKKSDAMDFWEHKAIGPVPKAEGARPAAGGAKAATSSDDEKWINQCVADNKGETAKADAVLKYCTCMNGKMDDNETQSITQWEKAHAAERRACERQAGWR